MDGLRFDALARHLCVLTGRRAGLRLLLAGVAAGGLGLASVFGVGVDEAPAKKHRKKKKRKKAARCKSVASRCRENAECCSRGCVQTGLCACSGTGNRCNRHSDCCSGNDVCSISACENVNVPICCGLEGSVCLDRCDCCIGFPCIDGTCGGPPRCCPAGACCPFSGKRSGSGEANGECSNGDDCQCCDGQICAEVTCNGGEVFRCCRESGSCVDDCDCCGINRCVNGSCQASACLPDEEVCPAGHFEPCCPPGSTCTQPGCVTDAPRACPAGAAVAGVMAIEVRSSGKPTASAAAFRNPPPRMGLFPVDLTCKPFTMYRPSHGWGPETTRHGTRSYRSCHFVRPADHRVQTDS